jgi:hypothetical protein
MEPGLEKHEVTSNSVPARKKYGSSSQEGLKENCFFFCNVAESF